MRSGRGLWLVSGAATLFVAVALLVALRTDAWLRDLLTDRGTALAGLPVGLEQASLSPLSGRVAIVGLTVAEPPGFGGEPMLRLGRASVRLALPSLFGDPLTIDRIDIDDLHIRIVWRKGRSNLSVLRRRLDARNARRATEERGAGTAVRIRTLRLTGVRVTLAGAPPALLAGPAGRDPAEKRRTLELADMTLTGIGGRRGVPPREALRLVLQALVPQIERAVRTATGRTMKRKLKRRLKKLKGRTTGKAAEKLRGLFGRGHGTPPASTPGPRAPDGNGG